MNKASKWRFGLAQNIAHHYQKNMNVDAIIIGGSVARGCSDHYSDIEIGIFWSAPPSDQERIDLILEVGGIPWESSPFINRKENLNEIGGADAYYILGDRNNGLKIDMEHLPISIPDRILKDVVEDLETDKNKQSLISTLLEAIPLYGHSQFAQWQKKANTFPIELSIKIVQEHLQFGGGGWWAKEMLAERDDIIFLYSALLGIEQKLLSVLLGLNRIYHPGIIKWMDRVIDAMTIKPPNLSTRLKSVFATSPKAGVEELRTLTEEVYELIATHLPQVDTQQDQSRAAYRRKTWETNNH